jgi:hypothetical protein
LIMIYWYFWCVVEFDLPVVLHLCSLNTVAYNSLSLSLFLFLSPSLFSLSLPLSLSLNFIILFIYFWCISPVLWWVYYWLHRMISAVLLPFLFHRKGWRALILVLL